MRESLNFDPSWLSDHPKFPSWVRLRRSPGIPATSGVGGRADEIRVKSDFGARMSVAGDERSYLGHSWNRRL